MNDAETITLTPSGPNRWSLKTPEHRRATLDDAAVLDHGLVSGDPWTPSVQARVRRAVGEAGARLAAQRLLRVRPRSTAELHERLAARYPKDAVQRAIDALVRSGAVDDGRLADQLAEHLGEVRPHARKAVRARLERARLASGLLEAALDAHAASENEQARALDVARAQHRRLASLGIEPETMRRRIYAALGRRGFDADTSAEAVEAVLGAHDDADEFVQGDASDAAND